MQGLGVLGYFLHSILFLSCLFQKGVALQPCLQGPYYFTFDSPIPFCSFFSYHHIPLDSLNLFWPGGEVAWIDIVAAFLFFLEWTRENALSTAVTEMGHLNQASM